MPIRFKDSLGLKPTNTPPANPVEGDMYYDDSDGVLKIYTGSSFIPVGGSGGGGGEDALNLFDDGSFESGNTHFTLTGTGNLSIETTDVLKSPANQMALKAELDAGDLIELDFEMDATYSTKLCLFSGWYKNTAGSNVKLTINSSVNGVLRSRLLPVTSGWKQFFMLFKHGTLASTDTITISYENQGGSAVTMYLDMLSIGALNGPILPQYFETKMEFGPGSNSYVTPATYIPLVYLEMRAGAGGGGGGRGAASGDINTGGGNGGAGGATSFIGGAVNISLGGGTAGTGAPGRSGAASTAGGNSPSSINISDHIFVEKVQGGAAGFTSLVSGVNWYHPGVASKGGDAQTIGVTRTLAAATTYTISVGYGGGGGGGGGNGATGSSIGAAGNSVGLGGNGANGTAGGGIYAAGGGGGGSVNAEAAGIAGTGSTVTAPTNGNKGLSIPGSGGAGSTGISRTNGGCGAGGGGAGATGICRIYVAW